MTTKLAHAGLLDAISGNGTDVTGIHGAQIDDGSVLHLGPAEAGEMLERPAAGYLAHSAIGGSIIVEPTADGEGYSLARPFDSRGQFTVDGHTYEVLDYLPASEIAQSVAQRAAPSEFMRSLLDRGGEDAERRRDAFGREVNADGRSMAPDGQMRKVDIATGQHIADADENARDLEALLTEHRHKLDTAVQSFDQSRVHTELHAHGRTLTVDTDFEATEPDNQLERQEADGHVEKALHDGRPDVETNKGDMHFRSQVHAYLDQQANDAGMSF